jgi:protein gp37
MGDLFHPCTPWKQIKTVLAAVDLMPQHTHIFLTKNPARYQEFNPWPENCWLGTTVTNQQDAHERIPKMWNIMAKVRFVSFEPLLGKIDPKLCPGYIDWIIIGALTGPISKRNQPDPAWVQYLIDQFRESGVPIFLKDNLRWPEKIQEFPR